MNGQHTQGRAKTLMRFGQVFGAKCGATRGTHVRQLVVSECQLFTRTQCGRPTLPPALLPRRPIFCLPTNNLIQLHLTKG